MTAAAISMRASGLPPTSLGHSWSSRPASYRTSSERTRLPFGILPAPSNKAQFSQSCIKPQFYSFGPIVRHAGLGLDTAPRLGYSARSRVHAQNVRHDAEGCPMKWTDRMIRIGKAVSPLWTIAALGLFLALAPQSASAQPAGGAREVV